MSKIDHSLLLRIGAAVGEASPGAVVAELRRLEGGRSSETLLATVVAVDGAASRLVVKVAPAGVAPTGNRDVLRQARILDALRGVDAVRVPRVVFVDPGAPPDEPPLFGMTYVSGVSLEPHIDAVDGLPPADQVRARASEAALMLAALHLLDPAAIGLDDEPAVPLGDELARWERLFETVDEELRPGADAVLVALRRAQPDDQSSSIVHGDYRLGNMLCERGEVCALIDWEIWGRGDPRLDLAWFTLTADSQLHPNAVRRAPGMPEPQALVDEYHRAGGPGVGHASWFTALALYKMAAASALIVKHNRRRAVAPALTDEMARGLDDVLCRARYLLDGHEEPGRSRSTEIVE